MLLFQLTEAGVSMFSRTKVLVVLAMMVALAVTGCGNTVPVLSIALSPSGAQSVAAGQGVNLTATVSNDKLSKGVTWSLSGAGTLSAQTATSVTYTAPSPIPANATATITATSAADTTKLATLTLNLQAVSIVLTPNTAQTLEQSQTVGVTAAVSSDPANKGVTWSITGAGALSGQTATGVTFTAPASITAASTATVTATSVSDGTKTATLTINLVSPPLVTTTVLPSGTVGTAYTTTTLAATGGVSPYAWSVTVGTLPAGLTLSSAGAISGTPTAYGTSSFTVQAKDSQNFAATANLSIKINPAPVSVTTTSLPNGIVNSSYSATLQSTGGATPITWSVTAGSLPTGLVLAANGAITGTPTTAGTANFTVQAADSGTPQQKVTKALSITVVQQLVVTNNSLPTGAVNSVYSAPLQSTGGTSPVTWSISVCTLPAGLNLNAATGAITGTPTTAGNSNFTVQATDSGSPQQIATKALMLVINPALAINTASPMPSGFVSTPYSQTLQTNGGGIAPITWSITLGGLPGGLTLTANTGVISGTPTASGTFNFTVQAADSGTPQQTSSKALSI